MRTVIKILIIEDEIPARNKIKRLLEALDAEIELVAEIDTVANAIKFLTHSNVDLIFSDIELLDGNAFEIYEKLTVSCPIIFTTAYDQFLMNAFESNGIAYLLKPFSKERFQMAWDKFLLLRESTFGQTQQLNDLAKLIQQNLSVKSYKKRFSIATHQGIYFLETEQITYFEASESVIFGYDVTGKKHLLSESTLKEIEQQLNPAEFFRINRSELVSKHYVERIERYNKNTLAIKVKSITNYLKTSQSNTASFREWIEK